MKAMFFRQGLGDLRGAGQRSFLGLGGWTSLQVDGAPAAPGEPGHGALGMVVDPSYMVNFEG